jgi:hypothetical protein
VSVVAFGSADPFPFIVEHAFCALVNCDGFSEELHGAGAKAPHRFAQAPLVIRGSPSSWIVKRSLGSHCHESRFPPLQASEQRSEQRHQRNSRSNVLLSSSCATRHYFNSVAPCWFPTLLRKLSHAKVYEGIQNPFSTLHAFADCQHDTPHHSAWKRLVNSSKKKTKSRITLS